MTQLIRREGDFPPGGFIFVDQRSGMRFSDGDFNSVVRQIIAHRKANPGIYPTVDAQWLDLDYVSNELSSYTCLRIGNNPRYCKDASGNVAAPKLEEKVKMPKPCIKCSSEFGFPKFCPTCSGKRLSNYQCADCGFLIGL